MSAVIACLILQLAFGAGQPICGAAAVPPSFTPVDAPAQPASAPAAPAPQEPVGFGWG